jgi:hypothetical protein
MTIDDSQKTPKRILRSDREDGRFVATAGFIQAYMKANRPELAFDPEMDAGQFPAWREALRAKVLELMAFPEVEPQPLPRCVGDEQREGYRLQRWECYPEPFSVVPFLMLVPEGVSGSSPAPAVMCFPGASGTKEGMAGEPELEGRQLNWSEEKRRDNCIALHLVRQGMTAVAVDNPTGSEADNDLRDRSEVSMCMLWAGRNYLGTSVFQKTHILRWLAQQSMVDPRRIATCGLSLGSDPADIVALLNPDLVRASVHNDFLCNWRERAIAMSAYGSAPHHLVPGMFRWFDAPDIQAALAPRPLLYSEGGRSPHISRVQAAYRMQDAADSVKVIYYAKYQDPASRLYDHKPIPEGVTMEEYFLYANVDVPNHRYHPEHVVPWLSGVLGLPQG